MTTAEKNIALQEIIDVQKDIEFWEAKYAEADKAGESTKHIDEIIEKRLARRNGMLSLLNVLNVKIDRKDYRMVGLHGEMELHTVWFLP